MISAFSAHSAIVCFPVRCPISLIERTGNFGWNIREGAQCFEPASGCQTQDLIDPVAEYSHDLGFSITGGYVYRVLQTTQVAEQGCAPPGAPGSLQISSFAEDRDGELYLLDYGRGQVRQLEFTD